MIVDDVYGISGAKLLRGDERPFVPEKVYTNDPDEMVKHCLSCRSPVCNRGECPYTRTGEGRKKYVRRSAPPIPLDLVNKVTRMRRDGWRKKMIARELSLTIYQVERTLAWVEKEGNK